MLFSRKAIIVICSFLPVVLLFLLGASVPVPYVAELPGEVQNVLGIEKETGKDVIAITGAPVYPTNGSLFMTSVGLISGLTLFESLSLWAFGGAEILPRALVFPPNQSERETTRENVHMFTSSEDNATKAALEYLHLDPHKVHITINLPNVQGPSAGLMFTLGIIDKLSRNSLTHGKYIAGTGVISTKGEVGEIGGITLKLAGAKKAGAQFFLIPQGNCAEALTNVPKGLTLVKVGTLMDAISALKAIGENHKVPTCSV